MQQITLRAREEITPVAYGVSVGRMVYFHSGWNSWRVMGRASTSLAVYLSAHCFSRLSMIHGNAETALEERRYQGF